MEDLNNPGKVGVFMTGCVVGGDGGGGGGWGSDKCPL